MPSIVPNTLSPDTRTRVSRSQAEDAFLQKGNLNELSLGVHGHLPGDPRIQAIFMAIGPDVPRRKAGTASMIDVTPTVLRLLSASRPASVIGRALF